MTVDRARSLRRRMPPAEASLWNALRSLRPLGRHFRRQVPLGRYIADFACHAPRLVIELDGETHFTPDAQTYDAERDAFLRAEGYTVLRFTNEEVLTNRDGVLTVISLHLGKPARLATPTLYPSPQGGGRRRSRKIVELGQRTLDDLPPPVGEGAPRSRPDEDTRRS